MLYRVFIGNNTLTTQIKSIKIKGLVLQNLPKFVLKCVLEEGPRKSVHQTHDVSLKGIVGDFSKILHN